MRFLLEEKSIFCCSRNCRVRSVVKIWKDPHLISFMLLGKSFLPLSSGANESEASVLRLLSGWKNFT